MNRALRKTMRGWKADFDRVWGKLNTFKRMAAATTIAIAVIYLSRHSVLDPMQERLDAARMKKAELVLPPDFTSPQEDRETMNARRAAQELRQRIEEETQKVEALQSEPNVVTRDRQADVLAYLDDLIHRHGIQEYSRRSVEEHDVEAPVPVNVYRYRMSGSFPQLHAFLHALNEFPYRSRFDLFDLRATGTADQGSERGRASLELEFRCILFFAE